MIKIDTPWGIDDASQKAIESLVTILNKNKLSPKDEKLIKENLKTLLQEMSCLIAEILGEDI
jgi:hypothetical protein